VAAGQTPDSPELLPVSELTEMLDAIESDADRGYCVFHLDGVGDRPDVLAVLTSRTRPSPFSKETQ